ncbi:DUF1722 domain-containing protein [candidate division WOR-3 bacterium]|nr:DUF1722 domain-containing protein [candidate division WOR-3 bacterium]
MSRPSAAPGPVKPRVVVSKCLGFDRCRWNGLVIADDFVENLKPHAEFVPVCPEVAIALGVPRDPLRVVRDKGGLRLMQPATKKDHTRAMIGFCRRYLETLDEVDGFILKSRSPSCGTKDVRIYAGLEKQAAVEKGSGFFGGAVLRRFPALPVEDEGRLRNFAIREHFLRRLFTIARFRGIRRQKRMRDIVQFQAENKFLLMAYNEKEFRVMGRIVANQKKKPAAEVYQDYEEHLHCALARTPRHTTYINVLMHAMGHFADKINKEEKKFFLGLLEKYRKGKIPLSSDLQVLLAWGARFSADYLMNQTFFRPYPEDLLDISDSGKGRNR